MAAFVDVGVVFNTRIADDAEAVSGAAGRRGSRHPRDATVIGVQQAHQIGAVLVANAVDVVHVAVAGARQAVEIGGVVAGCHVIRLAAVHKVELQVRDQAVRQRRVGVGDGEADQCIHAAFAAVVAEHRRGVDHHHVNRRDRS